MVKLFSSGLLLVLLLSGCGWNGSPTRGPEGIIPLTSIEVVADYTTIAKDTSTRLKAYGYYSGVRREITDQVAWSSGSPAVAYFITGIPGRVKGGVPGTSLLTATLEGVTGTFILTVSSATITGITIEPPAPTVAKGLNTQFAAHGIFSDTTTQDLTFDAAWTSSNTAVATVSDADASKGFAHAADVGTATITATFGGVPGTTTVTVTAAVLQLITVTPATPSVLSLSSTVFTATGTYSDGTTGDLTASATWSSSLPAIATVGAGGAAATLSQGTTLIRATQGGVIGATSLKVTGGSLTGISISPANPTLVKGTSTRLTATGIFSNGSTRDITGGVTWTVAATAVANVTKPSGNLAWLNATAVTTVGAPTTVSAKYGTLTPTSTTSLTVTEPTLESITITPLNFSGLPVGASTRYNLSASFSDGSTQDVTYISDWSSTGVASVGNTGLAKGLVKGVASGSATISATYGSLTVTAPMTVTARSINTLTISGTNVVISGNQVKFSATANYYGLFSADVTEDAVWTWSVDKPSVAILADSTNQPGQVVAVDSGSAVLTATFDGLTATVTVTVP